MNNPLVSVIIPTYNHASYLKKAISSIQEQTYANIEIIVMDDGSTDNTKDLISDLRDIRYFYQENAGLSAARNNAIAYSQGEYLLFLDADDWLYPDAVSIQMSYLSVDPELYFVSGNHMKILVDDNRIFQSAPYDIEDGNFLSILRFHYIAHPAAVMFRRKVFDEYTFDESLKSCQDFDLYLSIARNHKVRHHSQLVSAYRLHSSNMSSNHVFMLEEILLVMEKHRPHLKTKEALKALAEGEKMFINFYTQGLYWRKLRKNKIRATKEERNFLRKYNPSLYMRYVGNLILNRL
jgi:glycosyltransferase involved in cell wall biosynthesis